MQRLVHALDAVKATRSRRAKVRHLSALLRVLGPDELPVAARLLLGRTLPSTDPRTLGVGWALLAAAAAEVTGLGVGAVGLKGRELGDLGDALEALLPAGQARLPLSAASAAFERLAAAGDRQQKHRVLVELLGQAAPWEARYLAKAILGELRIGVQLGVFEEALAEAFGRPLDEVRRASGLTPDPGVLATLAAQGRLREAAVVPGSPIAFMLASPAEAVKAPLDPAATVVEDKLDGVRTQAHAWGGQVRLFARGQDEVTAQFPEVVAALAGLGRAVVLDGEILAVKPGGEPRPFQALQARLNRGAPGAQLLASTPVAFVAFDCLYDGEVLLERPWEERRARLEALGVRANPCRRLAAGAPLEAQLDEAFSAARARGHEGLVLKRADAPYEAGRRGNAWRKVKRAWATLDVVVTRAERGHGKRAGLLSDYTFAVWDGEALREIGRAYSGLTDAELRQLTTRLEALTVSRAGPLHEVRPEVVLEVAFDGLQRSARHGSGFALRFPRIARLRDDKRPGDADTLATARALFEAQVATGHREEAPQLSLFEGAFSRPRGPG